MVFLFWNKKGGVTLKAITKEMIRIYQPISGFDWMNYRLVKRELTYHHIKKRENGGKETIDNGAILMPTPHEYLHIIECKDEETYIAINKIFKAINSQREEPTYDQREIIEYLLEDFEYHFRDARNAKGKILIRDKYKQRG